MYSEKPGRKYTREEVEQIAQAHEFHNVTASELDAEIAERKKLKQAFAASAPYFEAIKTALAEGRAVKVQPPKAITETTEKAVLISPASDAWGVVWDTKVAEDQVKKGNRGEAYESYSLDQAEREEAEKEAAARAFRGAGSKLIVRPVEEAESSWALFDGDPSAPTEAEHDQAVYRDTEYIRHIRNRAGEVVTEAAWSEAQRRRKILKDQTLNIALALHRCGVESFPKPGTPKLYILVPSRREVITLPHVRRVNFLPTVAAQRCAPFVRALEAFVEKNRRTKMATFTIGRRRRLSVEGEIRKACQALHRRLSKLNSQPFMKRFGASMVWRSTEFGELKRGGLFDPFPNEVSAHIHAHVFLHLKRFLAKAEIAQFTKELRAWWGADHVDIGEVIKDVKEACKYPVKPGDLDGLTDSELAALFRETKGLHLKQAMGELREVIAARQAACLTVRKVRTSEGLKIAVRPDWNCRGRQSPEYAQAKRIRYYHERKRVLKNFPCLAQALKAGNKDLVAFYLRAFAATKRPGLEFFGLKALKALGSTLKAVPVQNKLVARLAPACYVDRISRPAYLVAAFDGNWEAVTGLQCVKDAEAAAAPILAKAEAALATESRLAPNSVSTPFTKLSELPEGVFA